MGFLMVISMFLFGVQTNQKTVICEKINYSVEECKLDKQLKEITKDK